MSADSSKSVKYGPLSAILVTLAAFLLPQILVVFLASGYFQLRGANLEYELEHLTDTTSGQFWFMLGVQSMAVGIIYWFMRSRRVNWSAIGLGRWPNFRDIGFALIGFAAYFVVLAVVMSLVEQIVPGINLKQEQQIGFDDAAATGSLALVFVSLVILPPLAEEIMIRGFLYTGLRRKLSRVGAALIASLIFGVAHLQLGQGAPPLYVAAIDTFVLSLFLIALRERTGSLWSGIFVHALKNGLAFLALFVFNVV